MKKFAIFLTGSVLAISTLEARPAQKDHLSKAERAAQLRLESRQQELDHQLIQAVKSADEASCLSLLEKGADVNVKDSEGTPALLLALQENHVKVAKVLLNKGANPCLCDARGIFPLAQVTLNADKAVPKELDNGQVIYVKDTSKIHTFLADALLTAGAAIDQQDPQGRSALHMAAEQNNTDAITFLVGYDANVNIQDKRGRTPLMYACKAGALEASKTLLADKADVNVTDLDGQTALMLTVETDQIEMVKLLVAKGALVDTKDDFGATAIKIADALGNRNSAEFLRKSKSA